MTTDRRITEDEAREIAREDAVHAYRDLSVYNVSARLQDGQWYIDYELKDDMLLGGGPHYVISEKTGAIVAKRYEQ